MVLLKFINALNIYCIWSTVIVRTTGSMGCYLPSRSYILLCACVCMEEERTGINVISMMKEYREL